MAALPRDLADLVDAALEARRLAYAPYSGFAVGAAVRAAGTGEVFPGCNVENAAFSPSVCAERVAITGAVARGVRDVDAVAVVADSPAPPTPCGVCRQVLAELAPEATVVMATPRGEWRVASVAELLPDAFGAGAFER